MIPNLLPPSDLATQSIASLEERFESEALSQTASAAEDFESVFVSLLLKELRQSTSGEGLFGGEASDSYGAMFDLYLGQHLAQHGNFGISDLVSRYLHQATPS